MSLSSKNSDSGSAADASARIRIGVDLGGTKIEVIALSPKGEELWRRRTGTPRDYGTTLNAISSLVLEAEAELTVRGSVGIGIPGTISPASGMVKNANSTWLIGHPLDRDLASLLQRPVRVMNDANCFALSEATDGAGAGARIVFGVILGTGVGGGIVVEGKVIVGAQAIAGEWGHNQLPRPGIDEFPGPTCYCGRNGCIETFLSGPAMARDHAVACGQSCTAEEIGELARQGDEIAVATLDRYVDRLGRALASVVNLLDPDIIVLGGGMSNLPDLAERTVLATEPHVFTDRPRVTIVTNVHGDSSGVRGAAWLWNTNQKQACSSAAQE